MCARARAYVHTRAHVSCCSADRAAEVYARARARMCVPGQSNPISQTARFNSYPEWTRLSAQEGPTEAARNSYFTYSQSTVVAAPRLNHPTAQQDTHARTGVRVSMRVILQCGQRCRSVCMRVMLQCRQSYGGARVRSCASVRECTHARACACAYVCACVRMCVCSPARRQRTH